MLCGTHVYDMGSVDVGDHWRRMDKVATISVQAVSGATRDGRDDVAAMVGGKGRGMHGVVAGPRQGGS